MTDKVCAIVGVGPGNGAAFARRFAEGGYRVALLSRNRAYLDRLASEIDGAAAYAYDAADAASAARVFPRIEQELGPVEALLYNAGGGHFGSMDEVGLDELEADWRINTYGLLVACQQVVPQMRAAGGGSIVVTGATAAVKHSPGFTAFTSAKAAQRALAQSLAKHLGPERIHVAYVIVDGVVDLERTRKRMPDKPDDFFLKPDDIAEAVHYLTQQPLSARSFELDLRPYGEKW
jgi:NADP-dependent 3-hydroxy acid dehydrogenase YdfG